MEKWTVQCTLDWTADYFSKSRIAEARLDAEILLSSVLRCPRLQLHLMKDDVVPADALKRFKALILERSRRKPVSYILGEKEFMGLRFKVNEHTLIPRPETEILVEEAVKLLPQAGLSVVVDIGTGSGNIPVSIAKMAPHARLYATDISIDALKVAQGNIDLHGLAGRIALAQGDLFAALAHEDIKGRVDLVTSNPPYIAESEMGALEPELTFEPRHALVGTGTDGLGIYGRIAGEARSYLKTGGHLVLEMNANRSPGIQAIVKGRGFSVRAVIKDYSGLDRVLIAVKEGDHGQDSN